MKLNSTAINGTNLLSAQKLTYHNTNMFLTQRRSQMRTMILVLIFIFSLSVFGAGQEIVTQSGWSIAGEPVQPYLAITGRASDVNSETMAFLDGRIGVVFNGKWAFGLTGSAMSQGESETKLVNDGSYHLYVNYGRFLWNEFSG